MYEIVKPGRLTIGTDGVRYTTPEERRTFRTAAGLLRFCLDQGVFAQRYVNAKPRRFEHLHLGYRDNDRGYDYHLIDRWADWKVTSEHLTAMRAARRRYMEILHYLREVEPEWRPDVESTGNEDGLAYFADNSTERHEINKYGKRRQITVTAPHGDVCF